MISGYQGSPLGGLDKELGRNRALLDEHHVHHVPGLNEELGATSAWGSQLAAQLPGAKYDGVLGMWYGKAPGLDRAADSLRHGNFVGVSRSGGGLAVVGDDPTCKSSTIPSASESLLASLHMPVFFPGHVQEVIDLGPARLRLLAGLGPVGRLQDRHERGRRGRHRPGGARPRLPGAARPRLRARAERAPARPAVAGDGAHACSACAPISPSPTRARTASTGSRARATPGSASWPAARPTTTSGTRCADLGLDERRARARRHPHPQARHDLAARAPDRARVRAAGSTRSWWWRRRARSSRPSSRSCSTAPPTLRASSASATSAGERLLPVELDLDADVIARAVAARLGRRVQLDSVERAHPHARLDRPRRAPPMLPMAPAHAVLLLRLPAQLLDQGARGHARGRRHRLPHDGAAQPRGQGRDHRHHADGRRGRAVDRPGALHRGHATWCRTSATAPSTTPARWPCAPPWPPA